MQAKIKSPWTGAIRTVEIGTSPATGKPFTKAELAAAIAGNTSSLYFRQLLRSTLGELQERFDRNAAQRYRQTEAIGSVHTFDFQADIYGGQFEITAFNDKTGVYTARRLAPSDATIERIIADVLSGAYYAAPGEDKAERAEEEIQSRTADAGREFKIRFVSAEAYAAYF